MNNPNPFVPKGSLLEQQSQRRSHLKIAVSCVLAVSIAGLVVMLIQGCKREQPPTDQTSAGDTNPPVMTDTNSPVVDTNAAMIPPMTNQPAPIIPPAPIVPPPVVETSGMDYIVVQGDTLGKIAKAHHVSLKDLEAANPGVDSKHLKIKQKLTIPASSGSTAAPAAATGSADTSGDNTYVVKSGDTLTTIAKRHGTTVKALMAENNLSTTKIKVKQVLKLPTKADTTSAAAPAPAPDMTPAPAPAPMPAPAPAPVPGK
jgi:LysM repeat protein